MLKSELRRALHGVEWWLALGVGLALCFMQYGATVCPIVRYLTDSAEGMIPHSVFTKWIGADGAYMAAWIYFVIVPITAALPFGASYYQDRKSGYIRQKVMRGGRMPYLVSKYTATFLSAGLAVTVPLLVNVGIIAMTLPSIRPVPVSGYFLFGISEELMSDIYLSNPYLYIFLYLLLIFVFAGAMAGIALAVSPYANNIFAVWITPFLLVEVFGSVAGSLGFAQYNPAHFLNPGQWCENITWGSLFLVFSLIVLPSVGLYFIKGLKGDLY